MIQAIKEHLLTVLHITYNRECQFFERPLWAFAELGKPYKISLNIKIHLTRSPLHVEDTRRFFAGSFPAREEIRLLLDGTNIHIPLQYRYLSLYKILELEFKSKSKWKKAQLAQFLKEHRSHFRKAGFLRKPSIYLHSVRLRCAHIKSGKKERFGVTHLNYREARQVERLLPVIWKMCTAVINQRAGGKFALGDSPEEVGRWIKE